MGFTLIEVIVAIFILSTGILAVLAIFPLGIQIMDFSETVTTSNYLAGSKIEEVISLSYPDISVGDITETSLPYPFSEYRRETKISYVDPTNNFQEVPNDTGIKKIEVTVSWSSALKINKKSIELSTFIIQR